MDTTTAIVIAICAIITLVGLVQITLGQIELRDLRRKRLEREARRAAINAEHDARMKCIRQAAKPIRFHADGCPFGRTATCLCGRDPNYSPAARAARGECVGEPGAVEALRRRGEKAL